jgi:NTP pyrophosphatase (non-canonical NTP hydrolase)
MGSSKSPYIVELRACDSNLGEKSPSILDLRGSGRGSIFCPRAASNGSGPNERSKHRWPTSSLGPLELVSRACGLGEVVIDMTANGATRAPAVVLSGSFRRDLVGLRTVRDDLLGMGCELLSPADLDFVGEVAGFVLAKHDESKEPREVEEAHLDAIARADFVWLHMQEGYVGQSSSLEVGFANGLGIPIFSSAIPGDTCLASFVQVVSGPSEAVDRVGDARLTQLGRPLRVLQAYYDAVAHKRGYVSESPQDVMLLLTEEVGELARAVRKRVGLIREGGFGSADAGEELADIQLYIVHLANTLEVDLAQAVSRKELINTARHARSSALAATSAAEMEGDPPLPPHESERDTETIAV